MVTHIVLWNIAEDSTKEETARRMKRLLEGLVGVVPGLISAQVYRGFNGYDVALVSTLESREALDVYQSHPAHLEVKQFVHSVVSERASCDFEN